MKASSNSFNSIVESIYNLPLESKEELKTLLEHNISDARRKEISDNFKAGLKEQTTGKLKFSSSVRELSL